MKETAGFCDLAEAEQKLLWAKRLTSDGTDCHQNIGIVPPKRRGRIQRRTRRSRPDKESGRLPL